MQDYPLWIPKLVARIAFKRWGRRCKVVSQHTRRSTSLSTSHRRGLQRDEVLLLTYRPHPFIPKAYKTRLLSRSLLVSALGEEEPGCCPRVSRRSPTSSPTSSTSC